MSAPGLALQAILLQAWHTGMSKEPEAGWEEEETHGCQSAKGRCQAGESGHGSGEKRP